MLREVKDKIIKDFALSTTDTGSCEVQVALISHRIREISTHLKAAHKDNHSRLGLLKLVAKRKAFLKYLKRTSPTSHASLVAKLKENNY